MDTVKGLIIIIHASLRKVTEAEVLEALPKSHLAKPRKVITIYEDLPLEDSSNILWESYKARQSRQFENELSPLLDEYSDYQILYFGLTHIPLAMHLGFQIGDTRKVEVFLLGYNSSKWEWAKATGKGKTLDWEISGLPQDEIGGNCEAVIRYGVYAPIAEEDTRELIPNAAKEVDVQLLNALEDSLEDSAQLEDAVNRYFQSIRTLSNKIRGLNAIHVFAAVPVGLAFLMGQKIGLNKETWIHIYHFKRTETPKYKFAMVLQEEPTEALIITEEDQKEVETLREAIQDHLLDVIIPFCKNVKLHTASWLPSKFPKASIPTYQNHAWKGLAPLSETNLKSTEVASHEHPHDAGRFYLEGKWYFSDALLHILKTRLQENRKILRAMRLFLFHEGIHYKCHGMTSDTSAGIGRYPKIVESLDYQADVYALLHEYAFMADKKKGLTDKAIFGEAIELMLETMWAFDAQESPGSMQMRRIHRYLIWYFIALRIEHDACEGLEDILEILSIKPDLEIKGLDSKADPEGRYIVRLSGYRTENLGIATIIHNRLKRMGHENDGLPLNELVEGFRHRDGAMIKGVLRKFVGQISD